MFKKAISLIIALSFVSFLVASLPGCGGGSAPSALPPVPAAYYVDSAAGLDTNPGSQAAPFKTITRAISAASAVAATRNANIYAASGVYNTTTGEVFPLMPTTGENLVGPTTGTANIDGSGNYTVSGGELSPRYNTFSTTIAFAPHVTGSVSGITANGNAPTAIVADNATVTLSDNAFTFPVTSQVSHTMWIVNGSTTTVTSNTISGWIAIDTADATTKVIARNNHFDGRFTIRTGGAAPTAAQLDLGTAVSPGNNSILASSGGTAVNNFDATATDAGVTAVGNTWTPNVQGADANGHYAAQQIPGPTQSGVNYFVRPTAGIQF